MPFDLVAYDKLRGSVLESIDALIHKYRPSEQIDPQNREKSINLIPNIQRQDQVKWLLKSIMLLDKEEDELFRARVLNTIAYDIAEQIKTWCMRTYRKPEDSTLYTSLLSSLELSVSNYPADHCLYHMYQSLISFINKHVYCASDFYLGYLPESPLNSVGYNIREVLDRLSERVVDLGKKRRSELVAKEKRLSDRAYGNLWVTPVKGEKRSSLFLVPFEELQAKIEESISDLSVRIMGITKEREPQVDFLTVIIRLLESEQDKSIQDRVLYAATYFIIDKIKHTYVWLDPQKRSTFYKNLFDALHLTDPLNARSVLGLYHDLYAFLNGHAYINSDPFSGYLSEQSLIFEGYSLEQDLDDLDDTLLALGKEGRLKAQEMEARRSPSSSNGGFFDRLWGSSAFDSSTHAATSYSRK